MNTCVWLRAVGAFCRCTQHVSPVAAKKRWTIVWLVPTLCRAPESQSFPTPNTHEPFRVVTREADGAPEAALAPAVFPIAPEPLVPDGSAPVNVTTVMDAATLWDKLAVTVALERTDGANARQISAVPSCEFVRLTNIHVALAP